MFRCRKLIAVGSLALGMAASFAVPAANAAAPVIISAIPDLVLNQLTINGTDLCCKAASVLLGANGPLTVVAQTSTQLVVMLPAAPLPAGNYTLSVQLGNGNGNTDESVVTIGAVDPQGRPAERAQPGLRVPPVRPALRGHQVRPARTALRVPRGPQGRADLRDRQVPRVR